MSLSTPSIATFIFTVVTAVVAAFIVNLAIDVKLLRGSCHRIVKLIIKTLLNLNVKADD